MAGDTAWGVERPVDGAGAGEPSRERARAGPDEGEGAPFGRDEEEAPFRLGGVRPGNPVRDRDEAAGSGGPGLPMGERLRLAVGERLPLWVRLRCGMEPKTLLALLVVLVVAVGFAVHHFWAGRPQSVAVPEEQRPQERATGRASAPTVAPGAAPPGKRLVIDVAGKVRAPGVHRLPSGSRVADALEAAGGVRSGADTKGLNRARLLVDGEQIVVGAPGKPGTPEAGPAPSPGAPPAGGAASGAQPGSPMSLSSATAEQLDALPGVGPVLAQNIIDYRTEHGGFSSVDQLQDVNGIGEMRFADIKPQVTP